MFFGEELTGPPHWVVPLLVLAGVLAGGLVLRAFLFRMLGRWAARTTTKLDDIVIVSTRWPSFLWVLIVAMLLAAQTLDLPGENADVAMRRTLGALLILSITLGLARLVGELVAQYGSETAPNTALASTGLLQSFVRIAVLVIGFLVVLGTLGINVAPILGALGIGGLAAGLALQPALSNLFAGFQIAAARQIRIGHRVKLSSGEEGWVADISWRTTTLRTPTDNLIIIPNSKFADSIVTNFNLPGNQSNVVIALGVSYDSDPRRVESILRDEAQRMGTELPQLVGDFEPVVRLQAFGESALQFQVIFRVREFDGQFEVWSELHQRLFARLEREGIEIPFPARDVYLHGEIPKPPSATRGEPVRRPSG